MLAHYYAIWDKLHKKLWEYKGKLSSTQIAVLMYHHITDENIDTDPTCVCKTEKFVYWLTKYINDGFTFVNVDEAYEIISKSIKGRFALLTFDDIPDSVYVNAYPILKKWNVPFVAFISPNLIDTELYITKEHLDILERDPLCTIGAHTLNHMRLRGCNDSMGEIAESKAVLERMYGIEVSYFAYPYGRHYAVSSKNIRQTREAGFRLAFGTINTYINDYNKSQKFFLPRIVRN